MIAILAATLILAAEQPGAAAHKHIEARIVSVTKNDNGCFEDLGYVIADDAKKLDEESRKQFPKGNNHSNKDNVGKKDEFLGSYVVVVRSGKPIPRVAPCEGVGYGIGFGRDEASAKKSAKLDLSKRWIHFEEATHGLEVVLSEQR